MKKVDTLRRLIREAVLAEMGDMWQHGRVGDTRMGVVVDMGTVDTIYFEGTPEACQAWIEENTEGAPEIVRGKKVILFKVWGDPATGRRGAWPGLNEMRMPDMGEPSSDYHRTIEAWLQGEDISSRDFSRALETWFAVDKGMPGTRVSAVWFGGPIVLKGPGFEGGVLEMEIEDLEHAFYG